MSGAFFGFGFAVDSLDTGGAGAWPAREPGAIITVASSTITLVGSPETLGLLKPALALDETPRLTPISSFSFIVFMPFFIWKEMKSHRLSMAP